MVEEGRDRHAERYGGIKAERMGGGSVFIRGKIKRKEEEGGTELEEEKQKQEDGGRVGGGSRFIRPMECNLGAEITVSLSMV